MKTQLLTIGALLTSLCATAQTPQQEAETAPADTLSTPGYDMLDEIVVQGEVPLIQTNGAKLTYNVDEDPAAGSSNVLDMLKKIPQVTVDGDGNIRLNGSDDYKLQVNGVENPMLKQYANQIMEAMPASMVVRIEIITEPGAKEDAEGTAGIINFITERTQSEDGYSGQVSLQAQNRSLTPSLSGMLKKGRVTLSANVNYQWGFSPQKGEQESTNIYLNSAQPGYLHSKVGQRAKHQYAGGSLNMSWEPNEKNLFTAGLDLFYLDANIYRLYGTTTRFDNLDSPLFSFSQDGKGDMKIFNISVNASYRHNFAPTGNYLVLSYLYNFGRNDLWINQWYSDTQNYTPEFNNQNQATKSFNRGHTIQADYANDFKSEHHLLETGVKGIFRHNTATANYLFGMNAEDLYSFPSLDSDILQPQNIYSAYASYTGSYGSFGVVGGLRYEHTLMGITDRKDGAHSFRNHLNDWVPNAALTWNFSAMSNLRLAYQMRISRPSIEQVNPFQLTFSPFEVREGNPDLTSEHSHIVSLKYSSFGRVIGGQIGLEYTLADNAISGFTYLREQDGISTIVTSYANIGKRQSGAFTGLLHWNIINHMSLSLTGRVAYNALKAPAEGYKNYGWSGNIGGSWNYTVADVYKFAAYGLWQSRNITVQGHSSGFYYYGLSAARDFLADKSLTVSVSANNFLAKGMTFKSYSATHDVIYDNVARSTSAWNVGISVTWKFGSLSTQVKKTGVEINNDDINSESNKGQSGI